MRLSAAFERRFRNEIRRAMVDMSQAAVKGTGYLSAAEGEHKQRIERLLTNLYESSAEIFGGRILDAAGKSFNAHLERKFEVPQTEDFDRRMRQWIAANVGIKITQISGTTHEQVIDIVRAIQAQAVIDGVGQDVVARRVQQAIREQGAAISSLRARTIARTESHNAASASTHEAALATGIVSTKEWASAAGERTRDDHVAADGQSRAINEPFEVGGELLMYPGDPSGSAENTINCRCVEMLMVD